MSLGLTIFAERLADLAEDAHHARKGAHDRRRRFLRGADPILVGAFRAGLDAALIAVAGNDAATLAIAKRKRELEPSSES